MAAAQAPNYLALLGQIHDYLRPRTYVEIGVATRARSFARVRPETLAVGIDPILDRVNPRNRSAKFFALESDAFFADHDLGTVLEGESLDLAFIDGMHLFEYALRDFMNLERFCETHSTILLHDCYPRDAEIASREPQKVAWTGDVWKLIVCLKECRPDLAVAVVDVPHSGLGVITRLDPSSTELRKRYDELLERFVGLDYEVLAQDPEGQLGVVPNDWDAVKRALPPPPSGVASPPPR